MPSHACMFQGPRSSVLCHASMTEAKATAENLRRLLTQALGVVRAGAQHSHGQDPTDLGPGAAVVAGPVLLRLLLRPTLSNGVARMLYAGTASNSTKGYWSVTAWCDRLLATHPQKPHTRDVRPSCLFPDRRLRGLRAVCSEKAG